MQKDYRWERQPEAAAALSGWLADACTRSPALTALHSRLLEAAGVRLHDIVDHIDISNTTELEQFSAAGWSVVADNVWKNMSGLFPAIVARGPETVWLRVEAVEDFLAANNISAIIEGDLHGPLRRAIIANDAVRVGVLERNGHAGYDVPAVAAATIRSARLHLQAFKARRRQFDTVAQGLTHTEALVDAAVADIGPNWACDLWLRAERDFWMTRCPTGRVQKARQDAIGIGWCNIDHHTYDGSRAHYRHSIRIFEKLGYERREMLYAGELAGWGSQVLEQPVIGSTIFADVDLAPHELTVDFAHEILPELPKHRRAGLLTELLGESILEAGLNHVAALYDHVLLHGQLEQQNISMMAPFTDWPHLYQALTEGDWCAVDPARVDRLEAGGHIGSDEAERLRLEGSIVTHLENIERNDGYKGFNREGIDSVLRKLDPRAYLANASDAGS
ncbi:hypothetical protein [Sphingorhabdus sp.]|jgi:hypothetical protein|uniref:hypothetical protein n=1 Tax=Sphingorhabdus sp. TaxID=1902408 RepID=UPI0037CC1153